MKSPSLFRSPIRSMTCLTRILPILVAAVVLIGLGAPLLSAVEKGQKSLYERLGGIVPIAALVDDFLDRLYPNPVLNANPAIDAARKQVPQSALKFLVTQFVCQAAGGPCSYEGRSMKESHKHLNINEVEWQAMMADFRESLYKFKVPAREQKELVALLESVKGDIVVSAR